MINTADLTHTVNYIKKIAGSTEDDYGQPTMTETSKSERCFYDFPKEELILTQDERKIKVDAILFMHPSAQINIDDEVSNIKDSLGVAITERTMRVVNIRKANDNIGVHHFEVLLSVL